MPIYEYQCQSCGHHMERLQRMSDPPLAVCDECGGELKKLLSAPAFQFKGSGWYVTDYAKKGGEGEKGAKSEGSASGEGSAKASGGETAKSEKSDKGGKAASSSAGGSSASSTKAST